MDITNSTEKKPRAARTPKSVIEERYAIFKDLAKEKLTFDEMVEVTGFPESQVESFELKMFKETKNPLNDSEGVFNLDKLLAELKKNILSAVSSGGIWTFDWDANDQSATITRHFPSVPTDLTERLKAVRPSKPTTESD